MDVIVTYYQNKKKQKIVNKNINWNWEKIQNIYKFELFWFYIF